MLLLFSFQRVFIVFSMSFHYLVHGGSHLSSSFPFSFPTCSHISFAFLHLFLHYVVNHAAVARILVEEGQGELDDESLSQTESMASSVVQATETTQATEAFVQQPAAGDVEEEPAADEQAVPSVDDVAPLMPHAHHVVPEVRRG